MSGSQIKKSTGFAVGNHISNHRLHLLVLTDWLAECFSLHSVLGAGVYAALNQTDSAGGNRESSVIEGGHSHLESGAYFTEYILFRYSHFIKEKAGGIGSTQSQLPFDRLGAESFGLCIDDKAGDSFVTLTGIHRGEDQGMGSD